MEKVKPGFALTVLNPPFVFGPMYQDVTAKTVNSSNSILQGLNKTLENPFPANSSIQVDVRDFAGAMIAAINNLKAFDERIIIAGSYVSFRSIIKTCKRFKEEGECYASGPDDSDELLKKEIETGGVDLTKMRKVFPGFTFRSYKDTIIDTIRQINQLEASA